MICKSSSVSLWFRCLCHMTLIVHVMCLWASFPSAYLVTYERAATITIGQVVRLVAKRCGVPMGDYLVNLYQRVMKGYNDYVELIGGAIGAGACAAIKKGNRVYTIADDIPLLHFLTGRLFQWYY